MRGRLVSHNISAYSSIMGAHSASAHVELHLIALSLLTVNPWKSTRVSMSITLPLAGHVAGRLTKAAAPVVLLDGRSLGPICSLTTPANMQQTPAVQVHCCQGRSPARLSIYKGRWMAHYTPDCNCSLLQQQVIGGSWECHI